MGLVQDQEVFRRVMDYNAKKHQKLVDNTNDLGKMEIIARALGKRGVDYDYALAGVKNKFGHSGDTGKLYNHPTFSDQSAFANKKHPGGKWIGRGENGSKQDIYFPSKNQVTQPGYNDKLIEYFNYEKGRGIDKIVYPNGTVFPKK